MGVLAVPAIVRCGMEPSDTPALSAEAAIAAAETTSANARGTWTTFLMDLS